MWRQNTHKQGLRFPLRQAASAIIGLNLGETRQLEKTGFKPIWTNGLYPVVGSFSWSPDFRRVVFERRLEHAKGAIYIMNADGTHLQPLPSTSHDTIRPSWSPDGQQIAFVWRDGPYGDVDIRVMNTDGGQIRRVSESERFIGGPVWSPDSKRLAFRVSRDADDSRLYSVQVETGVMQLLATGNPPSYDGSYSWSPDNRHIAFVANQDGDDDIFAVDIDNGQVQTITHNDVDDSSPAWSPSGEQIAFTSNTSKKDVRYEINVINIDDGKLLRLTDDQLSAWEPVWSPDGSQLAFIGHRPDSSDSFGIYMVNRDGTQLRLVKREDGFIANLVWLNSEHQIAYGSGGDYNHALYILDLDTEQTRRIYPPAILENLTCPTQAIFNQSENIGISISNSLASPIQVPIVLDVWHEPFVGGHHQPDIQPSDTSETRTVELAAYGTSQMSWPVAISGEHVDVSIFIDSGEFPMSEKRCDFAVVGYRFTDILRLYQLCVLAGAAFMVPWLYQHRSRFVLITILVILLVLYWMASEPLM